MRKGSKKTDYMPIGNIVNLKPTENIHEYDKTHALHLEETSYKKFADILTRLCDACHEMDNKTEPWSTIRKDIERLR
jgi:hypothetical protein